MGKRKKQERRQERKQPAGKQEETPVMTLSQKFKIVTAVCMVLTAIITIALLAIFF
jgi:hypothetical protein